MMTFGGETLATLREVWLMPRDIGTILPEAGHGDDVVVLVHGFLASAGVFRPLRRRLEAETTAHVASFTHTPGARIHRIAQSLSRIIDRIPHGARIHLVGHSLGGIVARYYVQECGGHARVAQTISIAAPFGGAPVATRLPVLVGQDLHSKSTLLERLRRRAAEHGVPHLSIAGTDDRTVPHDAALDFHGERVSLTGRGHNTLLFDDDVARTIVDRVRAGSRRH